MSQDRSKFLQKFFLLLIRKMINRNFGTLHIPVMLGRIIFSTTKKSRWFSDYRRPRYICMYKGIRTEIFINTFSKKDVTLLKRLFFISSNVLFDYNSVSFIQSENDKNVVKKSLCQMHNIESFKCFPLITRHL